MKCAFIIPCFNEETRINDIFNEIYLLNITNIDWFILNNGSSDGTYKLIEENMKKYGKKNVFAIHKKVNEGYGTGLKYVITKLIENDRDSTPISSSDGVYKPKNQFNKEFRYKMVGWTHADGQTPIYDVKKAYNLFVNSHNKRSLFIKGIRKKREDGLISTIFTNFLKIIQILFFSRKIVSPNSQPTFISSEILIKVFEQTYNDNLFDLSLSILVSKLKCEIKRFPVRFLKRKGGFGENEKISQKLRFSIKNFVLFWKMRKYIRIIRD